MVISLDGKTGAKEKWLYMMEKVTQHRGGADEAANRRRELVMNSTDMPEGAGAVYYVSDRGNDSNDGLSPEKPLQHFQRVADLILFPGDQVLFERGSLFRTDRRIQLQSGVYYGAYGKGDKPRVYGSLQNYAEVALWTKVTDAPIWQMTLETETAGGVTMDYDTCVGVWKAAYSQLQQDGDFYHDSKNGVFYLYYEGENPGTVFEDIEISTTMDFMRTGFSRKITVENFCFKYATFGPFVLGDVENITIRNCEMGWHGGRVYSVRDDQVIRYGNAVEFWYRCDRVTVENCWIYQVFDAAITFQGHGDGAPCFTNIRFEHNLIEYCSMNIEFWAGLTDAEVVPHIDNISLRDNIIRFGGYGWGGLQRPDKEDQGLILGWNRLYKDMQRFVIANNVLDCADCHLVYTKNPSEQAGLTVIGNSYYQKPVSGTHNYVEIIKGTPTYVHNQQQLEIAIAGFDSAPRCVKWLDY